MSFGIVPFFLRTGASRGTNGLRRLTRGLSKGVRFLSSSGHGDLRLTTIFTYGFAGRVCTLTIGLLRRRSVPTSILLPLVSRATTGVRAVPPEITRANPTVQCSRGIVGGRLTVLKSSSVQSVCQLVDRDVRGRTRRR